MFGGMNPKQMQNLMKQMGIKQIEIPAKEVIIKGDKELVIKNPQVLQIEAQGKKTFQIMGEVEEKTSSDDIQMIIDQTGASKEQAETALKEADGDLAAAILKLKD